jgi:hypothetical protein
VKLRDFVYLDAERIRSFVAQSAGGLTSERTAGVQHTTGGKGSGKGKVPFLAEAGAEVDYHYAKSASETKSLHDYIFEEFHRALHEDVDGIREVPSPEGSWTETEFHDGQFLEVTGVFKLVDFEGAVQTMLAFPQIVDLAAKTAQASVGEQDARARQQSRQQAQAMSQQLKNLPVKQLGGFVHDWYGDDVRIKIYPFTDQPDRVLVGRAVRSLFRYSPSVLTATYGRVIDAGWSAVVQVHKGTRRPMVIPMQTGEQLDDIMEGLVDSLSGMSAIGVQFPAIAITPLAIYRES